MLLLLHRLPSLSEMLSNFSVCLPEMQELSMESGIDPGQDYYTQDYYNYDQGWACSRSHHTLIVLWSMESIPIGSFEVKKKIEMISLSTVTLIFQLLLLNSLRGEDHFKKVLKKIMQIYSPSSGLFPSSIPIKWDQLHWLDSGTWDSGNVSHSLMDKGCFGLTVTLPIWSKDEKLGTQSHNSCWEIVIH